MKKLTCEMCGSTELMKNDGVFVCQTCGTQYSVEEAKKMMVEGTVEVQGTVKVDTSELVNKHLLNARRAKQKEDWEETEKYYNLVEQNDPTNIEAIFYSAYGKAHRSLAINDIPVREQVFNSLKNCVSIIDDNYDVSKSQQQLDVIKEISDDIIKLASSKYTYIDRSYDDALLSNITTDTNKNITNGLFLDLRKEFINTLDQIILKDNRRILHDIKLIHCKFLLNYYNVFSTKQHWREIIIAEHNAIKEIDPEYVVPDVPEIQKSGCYVATAVYGSYDCPQVWTLRRYRDYTLAETWHGRLFIKLYYAISPKIVEMFGETKWFKNIWKKRLDIMVDNLNANGTENTPYQDKNW